MDSSLHEHINFSSAHAHVVYGSLDSIESQLRNFCIESGKERFDFVYRTVKVDDVRDIQARAVNTSARGMCIVLVADGIVYQAQNALLKSIEEPQDNVTYVCVFPKGTHLLPTVLSRVQVHYAKTQDLHDPQQFLAMTYVEREEFLKGFMNEDDSYERARAAHFVAELIRHMMSVDKIEKSVIRDIEEISRYLIDVSSSSKQILLTISASLPVIKS